MKKAMGGCNAGYKNMLGAQGDGRMTPKDFSRNNMSKGGVNDRIEGSGKTNYGSGYKTKLNSSSVKDTSKKVPQ